MTTNDQIVSNLEFGVGSFTFETFPAGAKNDDEWEDKIRSLLESIPTIRDIKFEGIDCFQVPESAYEGDWESDGVLFTPHPDAGTLSFRVTIPQRIQRELIEQRAGGPIFENTETFYILTYYRGFPVSYVFAEGEPNPYPIGSNAVAIVRTFLEQEVERYRKDDSIRFAFIGPSPFPCDFTLKVNGEKMQAPYKLERVPRERGDLVIITYDPDTYDCAAAAIPFVTYRLSGELAFFYRSTGERVRRARKMQSLRVATNQLVDLTLQRGTGAIALRFLRSRKLLRNLSLSLLLADYDFRQEVRGGKASLERSEQTISGLFRDEIRREIDDSFEDDLSNMDSIVQLISSRQKRGVDITTLLISSLFGGVIGSILTVVLTAH